MPRSLRPAPSAVSLVLVHTVEQMMDKRELSYEDLMANISQAELSQLATAGMLTDATLERCAHIGRFMQRLSSACPNPNLEVRDVLGEAEVQAMWQETALSFADVGRCPLLPRPL